MWQDDVLRMITEQIAEHERLKHQTRSRVQIIPLQEPYAGNLNKARLAYPGKKRGLETEWLNFVSKHKNWKDLLDDRGLAACVEEMIRAKTFEAPFWPHFKNFVNLRQWEMVSNE